MRPVHVMLPCRAGSKRVTQKNTRPFGSQPDGLVGLKLRQLFQCESVASVVISTDDERVIEIAEQLQPEAPMPITIVHRPPELAISDSLDRFLAYVPSIMPDGVVLWTHVTSPFFGVLEIEGAIAAYRREVEEGDFDSLMGVNRIQTFLWNDRGCISHDRDAVKWPQTQDLAIVFEVNSSVFMMEREEMIRRADRIGDRPHMFETSKLASIDIDWPQDFELAKRIIAGFDPVK